MAAIVAPFVSEADCERSADGGSVARALPAIDVEGLPGHEAGRFEIEDRFHDVCDLSHSAERVEGAERLMRLDGMHRVLMTPGATAFTRMPRFAYSIASDLVAAPRPPFVRDASTEGT